MLGKCKLCLRTGLELQDSHATPKAVYKLLRSPESANQNPWLMTPRGAVQTSQQAKAYLLCTECEQRFNKYGENWIFRNTLRRDGLFKIAEALAAREPVASDRLWKAYHASEISQINVEAIAYFAASMYWRMSVHPWKNGNEAPVKLGPYEEKFRLYLMHEAEFPRHTALCVTVREQSVVSYLAMEPYSDKLSTMYHHRFVIPGLAFDLFIGKQIPDALLRLCLVRGHGNPIGQSGVAESNLIDMFADMLNGSPHS